MNAHIIVNKLLEMNTRGLPPSVEAEITTIRDELQDSANLLLALDRRNAGLEQRDSAVENLGGCAERLDNLLFNYRLQDFPALDWVLKAIEGARDTLLELLNQDGWAKPEDAPVVQQVADGLTDLLK